MRISRLVGSSICCAALRRLSPASAAGAWGGSRAPGGPHSWGLGRIQGSRRDPQLGPGEDPGLREGPAAGAWGGSRAPGGTHSWGLGRIQGSGRDLQLGPGEDPGLREGPTAGPGEDPGLREGPTAGGWGGSRAPGGTHSWGLGRIQGSERDSRLLTQLSLNV